MNLISICEAAEFQVSKPTALNIGNTVKTKDGVSLKILNIYVTSFHMNTPQVYIQYEYTLPDGKKGQETNSLKMFKSMVYPEESKEIIPTSIEHKGKESNDKTPKPNK
jgi:hypothetical protein